MRVEGAGFRVQGSGHLLDHRLRLASLPRLLQHSGYEPDYEVVSLTQTPGHEVMSLAQVMRLGA